MGSKLEAVTEKALFSSRWILAPIFLGLALALLALGIKFFQEAYHLIAEVLVKDEANLVLKVLALIDISLVRWELVSEFWREAVLGLLILASVALDAVVVRRLLARRQRLAAEAAAERAGDKA